VFIRTKTDWMNQSVFVSIYDKLWYNGSYFDKFWGEHLQCCNTGYNLKLTFKL
jgi:hypothetical protein